MEFDSPGGYNVLRRYSFFAVHRRIVYRRTPDRRKNAQHAVFKSQPHSSKNTHTPTMCVCSNASWAEKNGGTMRCSVLMRPARPGVPTGREALSWFSVLSVVTSHTWRQMKKRDVHANNAANRTAARRRNPQPASLRPSHTL